MNDDGTMARVPDLETFQAQYGLKMCTVRDIIEWRRRRERLIHREQTVTLPTPFGTFDLHAYSLEDRPGAAPGADDRDPDPAAGDAEQRPDRRSPSSSARTASA